MSALAKPRPIAIGSRALITFGKDAGKQGVVLNIFPKDAARHQPTAMIKLDNGRIVSGVPVNDLEVAG